MSRRLGTSLAVGCLLSLVAVGAAFQPENSPPPGGDQPRQPRGPGEGRPGQPGGPGGRRGEQVISLEGGMRGINRAINQLSRQITDASKKDENLRLINDAQRAAVLAKGAQLTDKELKGAKDEAGKAAMTLSARKHLMGVVRKMLDIEQDIIDGKNDAAKAKLEELGKMRDKAHDEFGVKDEDEGPVPPPPGGGGRGNGGGGDGGGGGGR